MLFCDMDGVLADFNRGYHETFGIVANKTIDNVDWLKVRNHKDFFRNLPPMPDMLELWEFIGQFNPIILTGVPKDVPEAVSNKLGWIHRYLGNDVEVRCCQSSKKWQHALPGDVLIDDWVKYKHRWEKAGGMWITHISAKTTIETLKQHIGCTFANFFTELNNG